VHLRRIAPDFIRYVFAATKGAWGARRMDWARILAYVTGVVDQELLAE
jgi:hypothetical protein